MRKAMMACLAAATVVLGGVTTADAQRGHRSGPGIAGGGSHIGGMHRAGGHFHGRGHFHAPRAHFQGRGHFHAPRAHFHGRGLIHRGHVHAHRHFIGHRRIHRHARFYGPGLAWGYGIPYVAYAAYAGPACELVQIRRVRPSGRVVWRLIERCY